MPPSNCARWRNAKPRRVPAWCWLLDILPVDARWSLFHCTHMTDDEAGDPARSGAVAGLCPITKASLCDGMSNYMVHAKANGMFDFGTDSHMKARASPRDEMRQLETSQHLALHMRSVVTDVAHPHPGRNLLQAALRGGAQVSARPIGAIAVGHRCDLVELDPDHPALVGLDGGSVLDGWVFSGRVTRCEA
jgi:formimidoylglutamate deiminase